MSKLFVVRFQVERPKKKCFLFMLKPEFPETLGIKWKALIVLAVFLAEASEWISVFHKRVSLNLENSRLGPTAIKWSRLLDKHEIRWERAYTQYPLDLSGLKLLSWFLFPLHWSNSVQTRMKWPQSITPFWTEFDQCNGKRNHESNFRPLKSSGYCV